MRFKILLALVFFSLPVVARAADFGYPFDQIAKSDCRRIAWKDLDSDCKMSVPKIASADYEKYKTNTSYRRVYSVLWGATYDYGWDSGYGSHQGVDIATSEGTPVIAIGEGTVVIAGNVSGWGNVVSIKHTLSDKTLIFSSYAHLSAIAVKKGDTVSKGQLIGAVGNTGNSYGNHLHFQIDITDHGHPYYYSSCAKGLNALNVVNKGLCRSDLLANTIDPIAFLENGSIQSVPPTQATIEHIKEQPPIKIDPVTIKSREEILEEEAQEYLKKYKIEVDLVPTGTNMSVGSTLWANISVRDANGKPARGNLPDGGLTIGYDTKGLQIIPTSLVVLEGGNRPISITAKAVGSYDVTFSLGKTVLTTSRIYVTKKGAVLEPRSLEIRAPGTLTLGGESDIYFVPKSEFGSYLVDTPYESRYVVTVLKGKAKFCNLSHSAKTACDPNLVVDQFEFGYEDTYRGYIKGKIVALDFAPVSFSITRIGDAKPIAATRKDITIKNPLNLTKTSPYYDATITGIKRNWLSVTGGYARQEYNVSTDEVTSLISRMLSYRILKAGKNIAAKNTARRQLAAFENQRQLFTYKTWTRAEFADVLLRSLDITPEIIESNKLNDENGTYQAIIATLRSRYKLSWPDQFGSSYFQPNKVITVEEALYMMGKVASE